MFLIAPIWFKYNTAGVLGEASVKSPQEKIKAAILSPATEIKSRRRHLFTAPDGEQYLPALNHCHRRHVLKLYVCVFIYLHTPDLSFIHFQLGIKLQQPLLV